jgi:alanine dehydrogenase
MIFGIPVEIMSHENRVGSVPFLVEDLVKRGHQVLVETKAGEMSHYNDEAYENSGAVIVPSPDKLYAQAEFILKVREPRPVEYELIRPDHTVFSYFHFFNNLDLARSLIDRCCTCYAYEMLKDDAGIRPLMNLDQQIVGQLAVQQGAHYLQTHKGGRGVLIGSAPNVSPAKVVILGASVAGIYAASYAANSGADVYLLDSDSRELQEAKTKLPRNVDTLISHEQNFKKIFPRTDLLITAIQKADDKSPVVVSKEAIGWLPGGAVVVDLDIDHGGSVETSKPTTHENPVFVVDGIIHYCVAGMGGVVPASASEALSNVLLPYLRKVAENGFVETLKTSEDFVSGLAIYEGRVTNAKLAEELGVSFYDLKESGG